MGRASYRETWLRLDGDLGDLAPFHVGLTRGQRVGLTLLVASIAFIDFLFLDPWGAALSLLVGLWAIWNPGNRVTKRERKLYLSTLALSVVFSTLEKAALYDATGLLLLAYAAFLVLVWGR